MNMITIAGYVIMGMVAYVEFFTRSRDAISLLLQTKRGMGFGDAESLSSSIMIFVTGLFVAVIGKVIA